MSQNLIENIDIQYDETKFTTPTIGVVIVIFNKLCKDSTSVMAMSDLPVSAVVLVDNSTEKSILEDNEDFCNRHKIDYCPMHNNAGLPKAYNKGIQTISRSVDFILILDDDTLVPANCIERLQSAVSQNPEADVFLPFVFDEAGLLSPCRRVNCLFFRLNQLPLLFSKKMSAINSGLVISTKISKGEELLFDEAQFLDSVDHLFIFRQIHMGRKFQLYQARFRQKFFDSSAGNDADQFDPTYRRFCQFVKDFNYFCKECSMNSLLAHMYIVFRAVKLNKRFRTMSFFCAISGEK